MFSRGTQRSSSATFQRMSGLLNTGRSITIIAGNPLVLNLHNNQMRRLVKVRGQRPVFDTSNITIKTEEHIPHEITTVAFDIDEGQWNDIKSESKEWSPIFFERMSRSSRSPQRVQSTSEQQRVECVYIKGMLYTPNYGSSPVTPWRKNRPLADEPVSGLHSIHGYNHQSALFPCSVFLRHCYLAAKNASPEYLRSFLDDTVLGDRQTTLRQYLEEYPEILGYKLPPRA